MDVSLGILKNIVLGENPTNPVVQILGLKVIDKKVDQSDRYRLLLSDGKYQHSSCMLGTQLNHLVQSQEVISSSVVRMDKYICNCVDKASHKYVIIILEMTVVKKQCPKLGTPIPLVSALQNNFAEPAACTSAMTDTDVAQKRLQETSISSSPAKIPRSNVLMNQAHIDPELKSRLATIDCLNPYHNKWAVKVRIVNKTPVRKWSNVRGEGRLFSFDIIDHTGEMRVTAFNEECDKFFDMIEPDKVCIISRGKIKPANRQFTSIQNDYEMTLGFESVIEISTDGGDQMLPKWNFNFIRLRDIANKENNDIVDIIAVARSSSDLQTIITRSSNKEVNKRSVSLVDDTAAISCTFWGAQADQFEINEPKVIALKGVRITDFSGRSLSVLNSTLVSENPDVPESRVLKSWYDREGDRLDGIVDLSAGAAGFPSKSDASDYSALKTLGYVEDALNSDGQAGYFNAKCVVIGCRKENAIYRSCSVGGCNKKLIDNSDGTYRCEKCNATTSDYKWRYILQLNVADHVTNRWVTCFNEVAEQLTGFSADELGALKDAGDNGYDEKLLLMNFTEHVMRFRSQYQTYNMSKRRHEVANPPLPSNINPHAALLTQPPLPDEIQSQPPSKGGKSQKQHAAKKSKDYHDSCKNTGDMDVDKHSSLKRKKSSTLTFAKPRDGEKFAPPSEEDLQRYSGIAQRAEIHAHRQLGLISHDVADMLLRNADFVDKQNFKHQMRTEMDRVGLGSLVDKLSAAAEQEDNRAALQSLRIQQQLAKQQSQPSVSQASTLTSILQLQSASALPNILNTVVPTLQQQRPLFSQSPNPVFIVPLNNSTNSFIIRQPTQSALATLITQPHPNVPNQLVLLRTPPDRSSALMLPTILPTSFAMPRLNNVVFPLLVDR